MASAQFYDKAKTDTLLNGKVNKLKVGSAVSVSTVTNGEMDVSTLFSSTNTSLMGTIRYGISTTSSATMTDRTTNVFTMAANTELVLPSQVSGQMRDFLLVLTYTSGTMTLPSGVTKVGDTLSFTAGETYLIAFTEISANNFYVRSIQIS